MDDLGLSRNRMHNNPASADFVGGMNQPQSAIPN
jgi:hypothetical protein